MENRSDKPSEDQAELEALRRKLKVTRAMVQDLSSWITKDHKVEGKDIFIVADNPTAHITPILGAPGRQGQS